MSKTFTCKELGGICDEKFSGDTFEEIFQKGAGHIMSDEAHKEAIVNLEKKTGENKEQWTERMQKEFDTKTEMEFDYTVTTKKDFDSTVKSVEEEIAKAGMRVLHIHDVQKTLGEKGFERGPFKLIEFCNAKIAHDFLNIDIKIGLCLPCKINVYIKDEQTFISGMRPIVLPQFFPEADLGSKPQEVDQIIQNIINNAK